MLVAFCVVLAALVLMVLPALPPSDVHTGPVAGDYVSHLVPGA